MLICPVMASEFAPAGNCESVSPHTAVSEHVPRASSTWQRSAPTELSAATDKPNKLAEAALFRISDSNRDPPRVDSAMNALGRSRRVEMRTVRAKPLTHTRQQRVAMLGVGR